MRVSRAAHFLDMIHVLFYFVMLFLFFKLFIEEIDYYTIDWIKLLIITIHLIFWGLMIRILFTKTELYRTNYDFFTVITYKFKTIAMAVFAFLYLLSFIAILVFLTIDTNMPDGIVKDI